MYIGGGVRTEFGPRLRLGVGGGLMPDLYVEGINFAIQTFYPEYTDEEAELVLVALDRAAVVQVEAGWRPFPRLGFTTDAAYTFVGATGATTTEEVVAAMATDTATDLPDFGDPVLHASAALHLLGADFAWEQPIWKGLFVRGALGFHFTVVSTARIEAETDDGRTFDGAAADAGEDYLVGLFEGYAHSPTATVSVGWAFGDLSRERKAAK